MRSRHLPGTVRTKRGGSQPDKVSLKMRYFGILILKDQKDENPKWTRYRITNKLDVERQSKGMKRDEIREAKLGQFRKAFVFGLRSSISIHLAIRSYLWILRGREWHYQFFFFRKITLEAVWEAVKWKIRLDTVWSGKDHCCIWTRNGCELQPRWEHGESLDSNNTWNSVKRLCAMSETSFLVKEISVTTYWILLYATYWAKHLTYILVCNPHHKLMLMLILALLMRKVRLREFV